MKDWKTTRPGALFLDAAGRKLADVDLTPGEPVELAAALVAAAAAALARPAGEGDAPATIEIGLSVAAAATREQIAAVRTALAKAPGVLGIAGEGRQVILTTNRLVVDLSALTALATRAGATASVTTHAQLAIPVEVLTDKPSTLRTLTTLEQLDGVVAAAPDLARREVRVLYRPAAVTPDAIRKAVAAAGLALRAA